MELEKLKDWIGQRETDVDYVTIPAVHRSPPCAIATIPCRRRAIRSRSVGSRHFSRAHPRHDAAQIYVLA
jgi:hypothetical protein